MPAALRSPSDWGNRPARHERGGFPAKAQAKLRKKARVEARYVLKTLNQFLWSHAPAVQDAHVWWKATVPAKKRL